MTFLKLTDGEQKVFDIYLSKVPRARKEYMSRAGVGQAEIDCLISKGLIKVDKRGSSRLTLSYDDGSILLYANKHTIDDAKGAKERNTIALDDARRKRALTEVNDGWPSMKYHENLYAISDIKYHTEQIQFYNKVIKLLTEVL